MTPITLPAGHPRCPDARQGDCHQAGNCARALVAHDIGRPVRDYTCDMGWSARICIGLLLAAAYRIKPAAHLPTVHETPKGLA